MSSYLDAAKLILGPLLEDDRFARVLGSSGDYLNIAAIERPGTLSSGELVLVAFAQAIYTQTPNVQASITELGKLDRDTQLRVLRAVAEFYGFEGRSL